MQESENILNELTAISPLVASIPRVNVYRVDQNYFDGIRAELQARIIASSFIAPQNNFDVPAGYFENLPTNILAKIKAEENNIVFTEMEELSATIAAIGNKNVYTVPQGYFEQSAMPTIASAKVVKMGSRSIFKYAAAAVITGLLGVGIFTFLNKDAGEIKATEVNPVVMAKANEIIQKKSFEKELENVSDEDLVQYLLQNGQDVNAALVASSVDDEDGSLPDAADYLLDENTLNDFLKENNLKIN
jgi:hypothetical protein